MLWKAPAISSLNPLPARPQILHKDFKITADLDTVRSQAGTIRNSKGRAKEVFQAPFHICQLTQNYTPRWIGVILRPLKRGRSRLLALRVSARFRLWFPSWVIQHSSNDVAVV